MKNLKFYFEMVGGAWTDMAKPGEAIVAATTTYDSVNTMGLKRYTIPTQVIKDPGDLKAHSSTKSSESGNRTGS